MPAVAVGNVGAKRGDLHLERSGGAARLDLRFGPRAEHFDNAKAHAHRHSPGKESAHFFRPCVRSGVVVFGDKTEQLIAHTTAGPQGLETRLAEAAPRR